ncbi:hypothetical protein LA76x_4958 [Lysobacter antibioticus]|uniref:Uncharacterized protein n=1 Tax=Lysobacter antibioticus TaxID=84531 RepID=A0A0S2FHL0_LYSAN|nr:hypothetical protein LA76x_4958 [Lysobacter antibioticus]
MQNGLVDQAIVPNDHLNGLSPAVEGDLIAAPEQPLAIAHHNMPGPPDDLLELAQTLDAVTHHNVRSHRVTAVAFNPRDDAERFKEYIVHRLER